jgi:predicted transcriptional regulator
MVDEDDLHRFDSIAEMLGRTRTSILREMMDEFSTEQSILIAQKKHKLQELDRALAENKILQEGINMHNLK